MLDEKDKVREEALRTTREIIRLCGEAVRRMHRGEFDEAFKNVTDA